jgi:hypothetical protein
MEPAPCLSRMCHRIQRVNNFLPFVVPAVSQPQLQDSYTDSYHEKNNIGSVIPLCQFQYFIRLFVHDTHTHVVSSVLIFEALLSVYVPVFTVRSVHFIFLSFIFKNIS